MLIGCKDNLFRLMLRCIAIIFFLSSSFSLAFQSEIKSSNVTHLQIISSTYKEKTILGLKFQIKDGWKIYGKNIEGIGQEPQITFSKKLDYKIIWPEEIYEIEEIGNEKLGYNIYKKEVVIPIKINNNFNEKTLVDVKVSYAICKDICIPVVENFTIKLYVNDFDKKSLKLITQYLPQENNDISLFYAIIFALIGGFILNFMPCVFPVLSIKLMGLIKYQNHSTSQLRLIYLSTIFGNITTFVVIATFIAIFKEIGKSFGWGLQFQNPYFLAILTVIIFYFAIYALIGNIQISGNILSNLSNKIEQNQKGLFFSNFLSGMLTVLLATPCSAPFLGSAISFALTQDLFEIFTILIAVSLGLASPYFILLLNPKLTYKLPKAGNWMNYAKKIMSILLMATYVWLLWVLSNFVGWGGCVIITIFLFISLNFINKKSLLTIIIATIFVTSIPFFINQKTIKKNQKYWVDFDQKKIPNLIKENKIVIVNITADWCLTCKFNEIRVFNSREFVKIIKEGDVVAMKGDLTKSSQEILNFIKSHNRQGIPFTIVYNQKFPEGVLASEIIGKKMFFQLLTR